MITEHLIRMSQADFGPEPETKYAWRWKLIWALAIAGILTIGAIVLVVFAG